MSDLPLTVRGQPSGEPQVENQENFSNWRPPKDKGPLRDGITNICITLTCVEAVFSVGKVGVRKYLSITYYVC